MSIRWFLFVLGVSASASLHSSELQLIAAARGDTVFVGIFNGGDQERTVNSLFRDYGPSEELTTLVINADGKRLNATASTSAVSLVPKKSERRVTLYPGVMIGRAVSIKRIRRDYSVRSQCFSLQYVYQNKLPDSSVDERLLESNVLKICD